MKVDESIVKRNVKNISKISSRNYKRGKYQEIIKAFSFFLSNTNRNYRYNESYLNDQYTDFEKFLFSFNYKEQCYNRILEYIQDKFQINIEISIVINIDGIWNLIYKDSVWRKNYCDDINILLVSKKEICISYEILTTDSLVDFQEKYWFINDTLDENNLKESIYKRVNVILGAVNHGK